MIIQVNEFTKKFGHKTVHDGVSFKLSEHECLGLIGGSGTGKSVLLRSLIGLEKPDSGQIIFHQKDISNYSEKQWIEIRKKIAYVFQGGALFDSMSVYENLAYPLREHTNLREEEIAIKIRDILNEFGLGGNEQVFPANLSGGMQKRVGLARAIIMQPEIILFDEPTAGLDPFNTIRIQETILQLKAKGVASILVTHDMPTAMRVCDRIIFLQKGKIIAEAAKEDFNSGDGIINAFMNGEVY